MSLKSKYVLLVTAILVIVLGIFSYQGLKSGQQRITDDNTTKIALMSKVIKNSFIAIMIEGRAVDFQNFVETLASEEVIAVRLLDKDGGILFSSDPSERGRRLEISPRTKEPSQPEITSREEGGHLIYKMQVPIYNEKPCHRCHGSTKDIMGILDAEILMDGVYKGIKDLTRQTLLFYIAALFISSLALAVITTFLIVRPLRGIVETAKKVEGGGFNVRFSTERTDEIGEIANSLNSMLAELNRTRHDAEQCHIESMQKVEKMATIGELASAIAHEIKNPLAGISGAIQVFAEDFPDEDPRKTIIAEVLREIDRLDKAVRDLLNFARPPEPHRIKTPILPIIERAIRLISPQAKKHNVDINIAAVDDIKELYLDPEQMQQVFLNIMLNALHSMPGGGMITITTYFKDEAKEAEIVISDTGHGISQEDIKNIFKPFFTTKHMGTGLGLAITKNIVEKHGGSISVDSHIGMGSNFRIALPMEVKDD